ncbi:MAG: S41 family peptidase [Bacteroidota bacterium]|nr:S41 family peptidase [Bacteroidota bacterium]
MKKSLLYYLLSGVLILSLISGCKKHETTKEEQIPAETIATNKWIFEQMNLYYLWNDKIPTTIDNTKEKDPEAYFYKLIYADLDKWSYITSDYASLKSELNGDPVTMGYHPAFYLIGPNTVMIVVCYVYPGSAADQAGLKRGDIILSIDNTMLDTTNYYTKYTGKSYTVQLASITGHTVDFNGKSLSLTAKTTATDPSIYHKVIDIDGHKIGYLVYVEFISGSNDAYLARLDSIFGAFKDEGISDLVVDLRYNPGGEIDAAVHLASIIAPASVGANTSTLINLQYNNDLRQYFIQNNLQNYLYYKFESAAANINMSHVYFLTTSRSASASELLIIGLKPYMTVVQVGEPTYGKYCGSWVIPDDNEKWAMMPIVMKFSNANGFTDFVNGLTPDYEIEDDVTSAVPFGDITDPMLAKVLQVATGKSFEARKAPAAGLKYFRQIVPVEMRRKEGLIFGKTNPVIEK